MATSIITTPNLLSPMQDLYGNYFLLGNPSYSITNFKYLTKLFSYDTATIAISSFLLQENVPPRPVNGNGLYSPYQAILSSLSYDLNPFITIPDLPSGNLINYYINYGIEYNPGLTISSVLAVSSGSSSFFGFSFSSPTSVQVGDLITITTQNTFFGGTATVQGILNSNSFYTNQNFTASGTFSTGTVTDLQRWEGTSSNYLGYNGTRQYGLNNVNYYNELVMGTTSIQPFLTDWPVSMYKYILPNQYETLSFFINKPYFASFSAGTFVTIYTYYTSTGATISNFRTSQAPSALPIQKWDIPVYLPAHLPPSNTDSFSIYIGYDNSGNSPASETRNYKIDNTCSIYNNVRLMWMNSYGSWDYFNFRLDNMKSYNITRNEYKKILPYNYTWGDRQRTIQSQQVTEQHTVNTTFITEDTYTFLNQLLLSPEVYVLDEVNMNPLPIIITDSSFEFKTANRDQIFNLTLTYQMSYDIQTQKQ